MRKEILVSLLLLIFSTAHAIWIDIPENSDKRLFDHTSYGKETTEINFSLNGYAVETVTEKGETYQKISYLNEGEFLETGKPALPRFTRMIAIPDQGDVSIEILDFEEEILSNLTIYPSQELQLDNQPQNGEFIIDERYYSTGEVFPSRIIEAGEPAIMRDLRVVTVTVNPFQYNPKTHELKIIKNIEFIVNCEGSGGVNIKTHTRPRSRFFESTYKTSVLNYNSTSSREDEFHQPCYLFIYPNDATVLTNLENLSDWKRQKGFEVHLASTAVTGTTFPLIKAYIQDAYDTWSNPPEFICLVGDAGGSYNIPTDHIGYGEGDHGYVMLEGGDVLADALIGRLSFNSIIELQTIIYKILNYEKEPYLGTTDWYEKVLLVADPGLSGTSTIDTKQHIKTMMLVNNPDINPIEVYSGSFSSQMTSNINSGVSYFNYRGWLGMSGFSNSSIQSLNNGPMLPVAIILTCGTGDFEGTSNCRSELFLKVGSPGSPKGGIAAIGTATCGTHT
ncbi:MAG: hypothetical protein KAU01_02160, partial [Candidatus Cloacimonetes bacterium]|nr:hypothetical protein [Candidatus Cloacimonadota bacterium]